MGKKSEKFITDIGTDVTAIKEYMDEWVDASLKYDKFDEVYGKALHDEWDAAEKTLLEHLTAQNKWRQYKALNFEQQNKFRGSWAAHKKVQTKLDKANEARQIQLALKKGARKSVVAKRKELEKKLKDFKTFLDKKVNWFGQTTKKTSVAYHKQISDWLTVEVFSS